MVTHLFECRKPGYVGWRWSVTVARAPAPEGRHRRRDRADPGRRGDRGARVGALPRADQARRPLARRPAPGRRRRPAAGPDVLLRRRPARRRREDPDPRPSPRISASAGSAPSRPRDTSWRRSGGTTATPAPTRRSRSRLPSPARPAASCSASPARWPRPSASAPTATPTTTAAWSPSATAAGRTPRSGWPSGTSRMPLPDPVVDDLDDDARASSEPERRVATRSRSPVSSRSVLGVLAAAAVLQARAGPGRSRRRRSTASRRARRPPVGVERQHRDEADDPERDADLHRADAVHVEGLHVGDDVGAVADLVRHRLVVAQLHVLTVGRSTGGSGARR